MKRLSKAFRILSVILGTVLCVGCFTGFTDKAATTVLNNEFKVVDLRDASKETTFNAQDGEYSIIIFGGIGTCLNTTNALNYLTQLTEYADMNTLNIYAFDIKSNTESSIVEALNKNSISEDIYVGSMDANAKSLYATCRNSAITSTTYTMPLVIYKNTEGEICKYSTGAVSFADIVYNLIECGYPIEDPYDYYDIPIEVKFQQDSARTMLGMMNDFRTGSEAWYWNSDNTQKVTTSLGTVTYDYELEEIAMKRAVELALSYYHRRPNGAAFNTAYSEVNKAYNSLSVGENIAVGYRTAEDVFEAWREDNEPYKGQGHRRNMLNSNFNAVGFACVYYNGTYYWVQEFSSQNVKPQETAANNNEEIRTVHMRSDYIYDIFLEQNSVSLKCGQTYSLAENYVKPYLFSRLQLDLVKCPTLVTANYTSNDEKVVKATGTTIQGVKAGNATLTANALGKSETVSVTVTHDYDEGKVTVEPTTQAPGVRTFTCKGCSATKTESIPVIQVEIPEDLAEKFATYEGYDFFKDEEGNITCKDSKGKAVIDKFKCDGTYTYYFQADGTAMRDRLTYHPDGEHVIYFDEFGHEVFSDFANVKKTIAGDAVDDYCFFDVYGYLYVDVVTYDQTGTYLYYANPYGVMDRGKWFEFSDSCKWADGTPFDKAGGRYGYANEDGTLLTNTWIYDWEGRWCHLQGNGVAKY